MFTTFVGTIGWYKIWLIVVVFRLGFSDSMAQVDAIVSYENWDSNVSKESQHNVQSVIYVIRLLIHRFSHSFQGIQTTASRHTTEYITLVPL